MKPTPKIQLRTLNRQDGLSVGDMTFPTYRHLLSLQPQPRHPQMGDGHNVQPLAVGAFRGDLPIGLALAAIPIDPPAQRPQSPELLSLFVQPDARGAGVGTALLEAIQAELARAGHVRLTGSYTAGKSSVAAVERVLEKSGWSPPAPRTVTVRFTVEEALGTPWVGRLALPAAYEIFPWTDLTDQERSAIRRSHEKEPWISRGLEPWVHDHYGFDPISSVGLRYKGEVVGWVINHRIAPDTVRFTCSFVGRGLSRRARILPLYTAAIQRLRGSEITRCTFVTPVRFKEMIDFIHRRCEAWVGFVGESRGAEKALA